MSDIKNLSSLEVYPNSLVAGSGAEFALAKTPAGARLAVLAASGAASLAAFEGEISEQAGKTLLLGPTSPRNAAALRAHLPWLRPGPLGLRTSAGMGDRLGLATPGHVQAVRAVGGEIAPIFAQQSMREMARTGRTPQQVMDDATWGTFQEGWQMGVGADADHLKTTADIGRVRRGRLHFLHHWTPANTWMARPTPMTPRPLGQSMLPCRGWGWRPARRPCAQPTWANGSRSRIARSRSATRRCCARRSSMAGRWRMWRPCIGIYRPPAVIPSNWKSRLTRPTPPTTHAEHLLIARELRRLGVKWVSLAPRYVGRFEKGVDYIGDLGEFERDFAGHAAIARAVGPYKLSLHSGSDKFSVYPIAARLTRGLAHLKTAGTSYLEALRTIAALDPAFFRELYIFGRERYETDRASYHVSAQLSRAPLPEAVSQADLPTLLDQFDAREILHVTFGSVLRWQNPDGSLRFYPRFMALLRANGDAYAANVRTHFIRHLMPFVR